MLKKPRILVVGSFMMDLIASAERAPNAGETVIGKKFTTAPGGKGGESGRTVRPPGGPCDHGGPGGDDAFGRIMTDAARAAGVDVSHVSVDPAESSGGPHPPGGDGAQGTEPHHGMPGGQLYNEGGGYRLAAGGDRVLRHADDAVRVAHGGHRDGGGMGPGRQGARYGKSGPGGPISPKLLSCATYLSPTSTRPPSSPGTQSERTRRASAGRTWRRWPPPSERRGWSTSSSPWERTALWRRGRRASMKRPCVRDAPCSRPHGGRRLLCGGLLHRRVRGLPQGEALAFASHTAAITVTRIGPSPACLPRRRSRPCPGAGLRRL